jgi:hypothetical protein
MDVTICFALEKEKKGRLKILDFYERMAGRFTLLNRVQILCSHFFLDLFRKNQLNRVQILVLALFSGFIMGKSRASVCRIKSNGEELSACVCCCT